MDVIPPCYSAANLFQTSAIDALDGETRNDADASPPAYRSTAISSDTLAHHPLIASSLGGFSLYPIGRRKHVQALVHPLDLEDHLTLLRAFHQLSEHVRSSSAERAGLSADEVWGVFLAKAVRRFELWVKDAVGFTPRGASEEKPAPFQEHEIPPLDVIMIWHTYLLNPRIYYEDGLRTNKEFLLLRDVFPLYHIAATAFLPPTPTRVHFFETQTAEPFHQHPFTEDETVSLRCPGCSEENVVLWYKKDGTGYSQRGFSSPCSKCPVGLTRETFGVARLANDLSNVKRDPINNTIATLLLRHRTGRADNIFSREWNANVLSNLQQFEPEQYAEALGWSFESSVTVLNAGFRNPIGLLISYRNAMKRILKSYNTGSMFSIDLAAAVNRQLNFVNKIAGFGWLDEGAFPADSKGNDGKEESRALRRCVTQYHAFLDLMAANPKKFLVPTLGIDLAWHTHQLFHTHYRASMLDVIGIFIDHDDAVEQENLSMAYEETSELWNQRYSVPYSVCGCPQPQSSLKSAFASKFLFKSPFSSSSSKKDSRGLNNPRPDLLHISQNTLDETHPSEHPAIAVANIPTIASLRAQRTETMESTSKKGKGKGRNGASSTVDTWVDENEEVKKKREDHRVNSPGFYLGIFADEAQGNEDTVDGASLGVADCMVGMGIHGACQGGNIKQRPEMMLGGTCVIRAGGACGGGGGGACGGS